MEKAVIIKNYICSNCNKKYVFRDKGYKIKILRKFYPLPLLG